MTPQGSHPGQAVVDGTLVINAERRDGVARVDLTGELDVAGTETVETCLHQALADGANHLVLDLRGLSFIDSRGLASLVEFDRLCRQTGCRLWIVRGQAPMVEKVLDITGLEAVLPLVDSAPDLP